MEWRGGGAVKWRSGGAEEQWRGGGAVERKWCTELDLESTSQRTCWRRNDGIGREGGGLG